MSMHREIIRKYGHIVISGILMGAYFVLPNWGHALFAAAFGFAIFLLPSCKSLVRWVDSGRGVDELYYLPMVLGITTQLFWNEPAAVVFAYAVAGMGDAVAALVGCGYKALCLKFSKKTWAGSIAMFSIALVAANILTVPGPEWYAPLKPLLAAAIVTAAEYVLDASWDNLLLPPLAAATLWLLG